MNCKYSINILLNFIWGEINGTIHLFQSIEILCWWGNGNLCKSILFTIPHTWEQHIIYLIQQQIQFTDVSPEQAIERQWPLIERHVWALRLPVRPTSDLSTPFEVWYAPGNTEYDAARNDPSIQMTKVSNVLLYNGSDVQASFVGFVGKAYDERNGEPLFFVERNVNDGSCLKGRMIEEGDWVLKSEIDD